MIDSHEFASIVLTNLIDAFSLFCGSSQIVWPGTHFSFRSMRILVASFLKSFFLFFSFLSQHWLEDVDEWVFFGFNLAGFGFYHFRFLSIFIFCLTIHYCLWICRLQNERFALTSCAVCCVFTVLSVILGRSLSLSFCVLCLTEHFHLPYVSFVCVLCVKVINRDLRMCIAFPLNVLAIYIYIIWYLQL